MKKILMLISCFVAITTFVLAGTSLPKDEQQVYTSVEGNVKYYVREGETVKKGTSLFFIERNDIPPSEINAKKDELDYATDKYKRDAKLVKSNSVSEQIYEDSEIAYARAKHDLKVTEDEVNLGNYKAPYDCKVVKLLYPQGSGIGDGNPVIVIKKIQ